MDQVGQDRVFSLVMELPSQLIPFKERSRRDFLGVYSSKVAFSQRFGISIFELYLIEISIQSRSQILTSITSFPLFQLVSLALQMIHISPVLSSRLFLNYLHVLCLPA